MNRTGPGVDYRASDTLSDTQRWPGGQGRTGERLGRFRPRSVLGAPVVGDAAGALGRLCVNLGVKGSQVQILSARL
jgi:hypothetical protein